MTSKLSGRRIGLLTGSASSLGGGVAQVVAAQAAMIRAAGGEATMFALDDDQSDDAEMALAPSPLVRSRIAGPRAIGYAPDQLNQLLSANLDLLHLHGIWMHPSRVGAQWAGATARPYLISPHGMLEPWTTARSRWKKSLARLGYERTSWARAAALHALTAGEAHDIANQTGRTDIVIIPNAAPPCRAVPDAQRSPQVLYLGRIHPKKNLGALIDGWRQSRRPDAAVLHIAGWGDPGDATEFRRLLAEASDASIVFHGPAFGDAKQHLLETSQFLILPSFSEGLPMVILEAWAAGTPTLMTQACNLPEGFAANAAVDCGTTPGEIAIAIEWGLSLDAPAWLAMARAAHDLASGPFSEAVVARRWQATYASLIRATQPA